MAFTDNEIIAQSDKWVRDVVIGLNFCPFAANVVKMNAIKYVVFPLMHPKDIVAATLEECKFLNTHENFETTLMILPYGLEDFYFYLDTISKAETHIWKHDYEGIYQVASFHPDYCFANSDENDAANYTNRSPYPMIHILKESSVDDAVAKYKNIEDIPNINIATARKIGNTKLKALLNACLK